MLLSDMIAIDMQWAMLIAIGGVAILGLISSVSFVYMYAALQRSKKSLLMTKRETEKIAKLPVNNPQPMMQLDCDGQLIFSNEPVGKYFPDLEHRGFHHPVLEGFADMAVTLKENPVKKINMTREINHESKWYLQTISSVIIDKNPAFMVYCQEITALKNLEKELLEAKERAEISTKAKSDFLANMSHELRTPMNGIIGLSDMMLEMEQSNDIRESIEAINASSKNLLFLLNDILDLSKIEAQEFSLERTSFDIHRLLHQIMKLLDPIARKKALSLEKNINVGFDNLFIGDAMRLQQILNNLLGNALKFTDKGFVKLTVSIVKQDEKRVVLQFTIEDNGIGIAKDKQALIFEKFTQADISTSRKYGGTGLGLSITKELVNLMEGTITLDSIEGKGTTIAVCLPFKIGERINTEIEDHIKKHHVQNVISLRQFKIMVVDDHPINLLFMRKILQKFDCEDFVEMQSPKQALELIKENFYDVIFLDCQMPEISGYEVAQEIRQTQKNGDKKSLIIALTANAMKGAREKCLAAGMDDYISKPFTSEKILQILQQYKPEISQIKKKDVKNERLLLMDWSHLDQFTEGDCQDEKMLIETFLFYAQESLSDMMQAISDKDWCKWEAAAHKLGGSAANIGAQKLSALCKEAELLRDRKEVIYQKYFSEIIALYEETKKSFLSKRINLVG
ncbi:MAG: hypothetical protein CMH30_06080 [Micavibrio sp.]|nr:hypothetical protein [Micavibrio sp.]